MDGCVLWTGYTDPQGYGRLSGYGAHRIAWVQKNGPVPEGMELDHLCRNRACVNPDHMEPVTHAENMRRSAPAVKARCINGHPYDEKNTYGRPARCGSKRDCRTCGAERARRYRARKGTA
jgi:hypothetical protein